MNVECISFLFLTYMYIGIAIQIIVKKMVSFQDNSQNAPLVGSTLETLLRFLNWIPLGYIFETKLITTLIYKVSLQRNPEGVFSDTSGNCFFLISP